MIIPSIDVMGGTAVQLVGGRERRLDAGDPRPIAERFAVAGEVAVVDLDAALLRGENRVVIEALLALAPCRVGGGIRDEASAWRWLEAGASKVVIGTRAEPGLLRRLPAERVVAALDAIDGDVVVEGWRTRTGRGVLERVVALREHVGGFLVTFVEREGRMEGVPVDRVAPIVEAARGRRVTIAGGVRDAGDVAALARLGVEAQVGMALYTGALTLADAIWACVRSDRADGLVPTVVTDERGVALGLAYSGAESLRAAVERRAGVYWSRSRGALWVKGETSGATQALVRVTPDCDGDALRFTVRQSGAGFCHRGTATCFGGATGLAALEPRLRARAAGAPAGSFTRRLLDEPGLLRAKLIEEAGELAEATARADVAWEAADVLYFTLAALARAGVPLAEVERELDRRAGVPKGAVMRALREGGRS